jgi:hypothetical protein
LCRERLLKDSPYFPFPYTRLSVNPIEIRELRGSDGQSVIGLTHDAADIAIIRQIQTDITPRRVCSHICHSPNSQRNYHNRSLLSNKVRSRASPLFERTWRNDGFCGGALAPALNLCWQVCGSRHPNKAHSIHNKIALRPFPQPPRVSVNDKVRDDEAEHGTDNEVAKGVRSR